MHDCAKEIVAFHDENVTLKQVQRTQMRDHRDANRARLKQRLKEEEKPLPKEFIKQGSYAMLTMVQDPDNDYDIDDGVYFTIESLKDKDGNEISPKDTRQMLCAALKDNRFNKQPQVRSNCVRIFYEEGYHVDMPAYRINNQGAYELASGDTWVSSRAADVEDWFNSINQQKSPDDNNGRQFRRIVRYLKKIARSRKNWKDQIASGFTITKLTAECYLSNKDREDLCLRDTMKSIYNRLLVNLEVNHPVTIGAKLTKGVNDESTAFLRDKLCEALDVLKNIESPNCTKNDVLSAWDKVFNTDFFSSRYKEEQDTKSNATILSNLISADKNPPAVEKKGGGTFA